MFQSTYLYKVRRRVSFNKSQRDRFQSTYLYKVRRFQIMFSTTKIRFNPRTYIRYDLDARKIFRPDFLFQSTYLYKVRPQELFRNAARGRFQSTYLYKVRRSRFLLHFYTFCFNPRTYIRYDDISRTFGFIQPCFNPRTYIRYDCITNNANIYSLLSMHLCDNKLFGFFIDEIKLIGVFNRLIINDCENSSFLLMLNVRKQLYYKFIFYIIGCDDTYVFNSFRIIISQEIETNTIFFMIDDIR